MKKIKEKNNFSRLNYKKCIKIKGNKQNIKEEDLANKDKIQQE